MSTSIQEKGKGDEEAFFKRMDSEKKAQLRASFEKILETEGSEKHEEILEILGQLLHLLTYSLLVLYRSFYFVNDILFIR